MIYTSLLNPCLNIHHHIRDNQSKWWPPAGEPTPRNTPGGAFGEISDRAPDAGLRIFHESLPNLQEFSLKFLAFLQVFEFLWAPHPLFSCVLSDFFLELSKSFSTDLKRFLRAFEVLLKSFHGDFKELPKSFQGAFGELPRSF